MLFCRRCGTELTEEGTCPNCAYVDEIAYQKNNPEEEPQVSKLDKAKNFLNDMIYSDDGEIDFKQAFNNVMDTEESFEFDKTDIEQNKAFAVLSYIGILVLIPYFFKKDSEFTQYHAKQGLVLAISMVVYNVAVAILNGILSFILPDLISNAIGIIFGIVNLAFIALAVLGIVNVVNNKAKQLPFMDKVDELIEAVKQRKSEQ